jgi:hypothetical protein
MLGMMSVQFTSHVLLFERKVTVLRTRSVRCRLVGYTRSLLGGQLPLGMDFDLEIPAKTRLQPQAPLVIAASPDMPPQPIGEPWPSIRGHIHMMMGGGGNPTFLVMTTQDVVFCFTLLRAFSDFGRPVTSEITAVVLPQGLELKGQTLVDSRP